MLLVSLPHMLPLFDKEGKKLPSEMLHFCKLPKEIYMPHRTTL